MAMESQNQNQDSLESEHISLLHEKILQERNNRFSLDSQLSQKALLENNNKNDNNNNKHNRHEHEQQQSPSRPRHISNTKVPRMKPSSTAPSAGPAAGPAAADMESPSQVPAPAMIKHMTFNGYPIDMDGDTQPMPSQFYQNYTSAIYTENDESQVDKDTTDKAAEIDLMQHWPEMTYHEISRPEMTYHEISSDNESDSAPQDQDETQYFLSSVNRPTTFPKTPATAGHKRNHGGDVVSTSSTKTPGSGGMSAFGFSKATALSGTQLFQATQAASSPVPFDFPRSDPVLSRPSPNMRQISSPGAMSSPSKGILHGSVSALRNTSTHHVMDQEEERNDNPDNDVFDADRHLHHSPGSVSMDEYDEYAQEIRPSQRQQSSSPRLDQSDAEEEAINSSSRTSASISPHRIDQAETSLPSLRVNGVHQSPQPDAETMDPEMAVADSQPTRTETQLPPPLVEPSSMSSFIPASYPLNSSEVMRTRLDTLRRGADVDGSSPFPQPPPATSQADQDMPNRVPSSPPQMPAIIEEGDKQTQLHLPSQVVQNPVSHASVSCQLPDTQPTLSPQLPDTQPAMSQRANQVKEASQRHSDNVPETDPMELDHASNHNTDSHQHQPTHVANRDTRLAQQQPANTTSKTDAPPDFTIPPPSQSKQRPSQLATQSQTSALTQESPRKAAGILNFAAIANGANPYDPAKDMDVNIDLLSNEDHDFMHVINSPPAKKMRMYGKKAKALEKAKARPSTSPVKKSVAVTFEEAVAEEEPEQETVTGIEDVEPVAIINGLVTENGRHEHDQQVETDKPADYNKEVEPTATADVVTTNEVEKPSESVEEVKEREDDTVRTPQSSPPVPTKETPLAARDQEQVTSEVTSKSRDALLARRKGQSKTPDTNTPRGKLVRPKKRDLNTPLRTPITRRQDMEAPKSKLRHVEGVSDGVQPQKEQVVTHDHEAQPADTTETTEQPQQRQADEGTDVSMADVASEHSVSNATETSDEITQPDRVLALFKGTGQAYYPATCLGAATLDGLKLRIRFDDGTVTQLDSFLVRRLELRRGDQVKVDLQGMRSKSYVVAGYQDKVQEVAPDSYPTTDIHGFETILLVPKDRDSMAAPPRAETAALIRVPCTSIYLTQTMWIRFSDRHYLPSSAIAVASSSRLSTPVPQRHDPATPSSRARRWTLTSNHSISRPDLASPLPSGRGVFAGMAFAVSYCSEDAASSAEKDRVLELIHAHGGLVLDKGFDELFSIRDLNETSEDSTPRQSSTGEEDALNLSARAQSLGFVALIADRHSRRAKYIQALALSLPCLAGRWILDSVAAGHAVSWPKYLLPAGESAYLSGAVRSRTMASYDATSIKLADTIQGREKLLQGGKVLLVGGGPGARKWEARRPYAFLTVALGASVVRRVTGLESARQILDSEDSWGWVYVEGKIEDAEKVLFGQGNGAVTEGEGRKRKRKGWEEKDKMVASREDGKVRIVGDEFVVQSLILGDLMV